MNNIRRIKRRRKAMARLFKGLPSWQLNSHDWMLGLVRRGIKWHTALRWLRKNQSVIRMPSGEVFITDHFAGSSINTVKAVCQALGLNYQIEYYDLPKPKANVCIRTSVRYISCVSTMDCISELDNAKWFALKLLETRKVELMSV